jgi:hypothetical protein
MVIRVIIAHGPQCPAQGPMRISTVLLKLADQLGVGGCFGRLNGSRILGQLRRAWR